MKIKLFLVLIMVCNFVFADENKTFFGIKLGEKIHNVNIVIPGTQYIALGKIVRKSYGFRPPNKQTGIGISLDRYFGEQTFPWHYVIDDIVPPIKNPFFEKYSIKVSAVTHRIFEISAHYKEKNDTYYLLRDKITKKYHWPNRGVDTDGNKYYDFERLYAKDPYIKSDDSIEYKHSDDYIPMLGEKNKPEYYYRDYSVTIDFNNSVFIVPQNKRYGENKISYRLYEHRDYYNHPSNFIIRESRQYNDRRNARLLKPEYLDGL